MYISFDSFEPNSYIIRTELYLRPSFAEIGNRELIFVFKFAIREYLFTFVFVFLKFFEIRIHIRLLFFLLIFMNIDEYLRIGQNF
jgi:hypothetical protein